MKSDVYVTKGGEFMGLNIDGLELSLLQRRVEGAVAKWKMGPGKENCAVEYNYESLAHNEEV